MACKANNDMDAAVQIIAAAPRGIIKGNVTLHSAAYLLEIAGVGYGFKFGCKFCSPYCEELELAINGAKVLSEVEQIQTTTEWGVTKTTYKSNIPYHGDANDNYQIIVTKATQCVQKQLNLATSAAYYQKVEIADPWHRIWRIKNFDRESDTFEKSKELYEELRSMPALANLPKISVPTKLAAQVQV